jgi:hypothetical protein
LVPVDVPPLPAPTESAIIPPFNPPTTSSKETLSQGPPTPPRSRAPSPLFPADDEIEALRPHRARNASASASRRSTPSRTSNEELRKERVEPTRRTSGYTLATKNSADDKSIKSDKSERSERSSSSRYTCESRSAAIKGLYPNSPLAGAPISSSPPKEGMQRRKSLRRTERTILSGGTWDTTTVSVESENPRADPPPNP